MSMPNKVSITCPKCHAAFSTTMWNSVNTDLDKELPAKIISGEFFDAKCPKCDFIAHLEYDTLYHDMKHSAMVWVVHNHENGYKDKIQDIRKTDLLPGYTTRIVFDMNMLREKVAALEAGRDDRVIELCKVYLKNELIHQSPDFQTVNTFYTYSGGKEIVFFYNASGKELSCNLQPELYDAISSMFASALSAVPTEPYAIYDAKWADTLFNFVPEDDSKVTEVQNPISEDADQKLCQIENELQELEKKLKLGYNDPIIIKESEGTGLTPEQYKKFLRLQYQEKQIMYNQLIDKYGLSSIKEKQIIDTFTEHMLEGGYKLLDKVEIDIRKRMRESSILSHCGKLTESDEYVFYYCNGTMLRETKSTGEIVYFGTGRSVVACVFADKFYWYDWRSILSDKYIYRCNLDGSGVERFDWLSNEKTMELLGHSAHCVSVDTVTAMYATNTTLVIEVKRSAESGGKYRIIVTEVCSKLQLQREIIEGEMKGLQLADRPSDALDHTEGQGQNINTHEATDNKKDSKKLSFQAFLDKYRKDRRD